MKKRLIRLVISEYHDNVEMSIGGYYIDFERNTIKTYTAKSIVEIDFTTLQPKILRRISKINTQFHQLLVEYKS